MKNFLTSKISGYLALIQFALILAAVLAVYFYGWSECKEAQIVKHVNILEKRNEIVNSRPDDRALYSGLLKGNAL